MSRLMNNGALVSILREMNGMNHITIRSNYRFFQPSPDIRLSNLSGIIIGCKSDLDMMIKKLIRGHLQSP
ncbi:hypothetical protein SDC9_122669 [bioreactor metagenome]|uniref:Uncharacterized protein n=1 Tax=bioreactor metagenome TaxID=1076179 RepID=A0A645CFJ8_9ZZZZ